MKTIQWQFLKFRFSVRRGGLAEVVSILCGMGDTCSLLLQHGGSFSWQPTGGLATEEGRRGTVTAVLPTPPLGQPPRSQAPLFSGLGTPSRPVGSFAWPNLNKELKILKKMLKKNRMPFPYFGEGGVQIWSTQGAKSVRYAYRYTRLY